MPSRIDTLLVLEERIMFDCVPLANGAEVVQDQVAQDQPTPEEDPSAPDVKAEANTSLNLIDQQHCPPVGFVECYYAFRPQ